MGLVAVGVLALALPGTALAAVTIGSNLQSTANGNLINADLTQSQRNLPASRQASGGLTSPINGVVVRWRIKAGDDPAGAKPVRFRVIRPGGDISAATGAGTSPLGDPAFGTTTSFVLNPGLPIKIGDGIGIDTQQDPATVIPYTYAHFEFDVGELNRWQPQLADGGAPQAPSVGFNHELLLQAVIEPDKDNDTLGDETQDPDGGNPPVAPPPCRLVRLGTLICL